MNVHPYCLCTSVSAAALEALLEVGPEGAYRTDHPWWVARRLWQQAAQAGESMPLLLAAGEPLAHSRWAMIEAIEVTEFHSGSHATVCRFGALQPVNPIWSPIDSVFLKPSQEQLDRERLEGLRAHRSALSHATLFPYAICETPAFINNAAVDT
jgi:hypothetical protein